VLTEPGLRKFEAARASHHRDIAELFGSSFSEEEQAQLAGLLGRLPLAETAKACSE
jgi:DNA-binding MarR family transcriptional regulator